MSKKLLLGYIFLLSLCFTLKVNAQDPDTISFTPNQATLKDTVSVNFYLQAAKQYTNAQNYPRALDYVLRGSELALFLGYEKGIVESWKLLGRISAYTGKYELALDYQHQALEHYDKKQDEQGKLECMNYLADIYTLTKEFEQAMEYKFQALKLEEKYRDDKAIAKSYTQMAALYAELKNYELAFNYSSKSISIREKLNDRRGLADSYKVLGGVHAKSKSYKSALEYFRKSLTLKDSVKNSTDIGELLNNIGDVYNEQGSPQQAAVFYKQSYEKEKALGNKQGTVTSLINIGKNAIDLQEYKMAADYIKEALILAEGIESKDAIDACYLHLSRIYEKSKNINEALKYYKLYTDYQKLIFDENNDKRVAEMHEIIETNRREKEIAIINQERQIHALEISKAETSRYILIILIFFVILLFVATLIFLRTVERKNKQLAASNQLISQKSLMMEELNNTKNKFFSIIAHDLKTPLNSLSGFSNLIINHIEYLSKEEIKMMATDLDKSVRNLYDLLNNLLTWARSQMNTIEFKPQNLEVQLLFDDLIGLIQLNAQNKKIHIVTNVAHDTKVYVDENAIKTILRNLASNALKFTPEEGKITFTARNYNEKFVQIAINDTGVGMDDETMAKIFRIDSKHSTKGTQGETGTGLGLLLCKEFVEKNGGSITVDSVLDVGTTFKVLLPIGH